MIEAKRKEYKLSLEAIDDVSKEFSQTLTEAGVDKKDCIRLRLSLEEILEGWLGSIPDAPVTYVARRRLGKDYAEVRVRGHEISPGEDLEDYALSNKLLAQAGLSLNKGYSNGENTLCVYLRKKRKTGQMQRLVVAIVLAVGLGLLQRLLPNGVQSTIRAVTDPLFSLILNLLCSISSPMIFLAICWGIFNVGDMSAMGRIGKRVIFRFVILTFLVDAIATVFIVWFFPLEFSMDGTSLSGFSEIYQIVLDIVPSNIVSPFLEGNTLQIIFLGAAVGFALLVLGDRVSATRAIIEQMNEVVSLLMEAISSLIPVFVFFSLFSLMGSDFGSEMVGIFKALAITFVLCPVLSLVFIAVLSVRYKVGFGLLVRKLLPTFLIGVTTASSAAAFATNMETCEKKLGIPETISHFAVPLGQVIFKPGALIGFTAVCLCMAENYGVSITPAWIVTMVIVTSLLSMAAPPIPGGALTCYTVMFTQLSIPMEAVAIAVAINSIIDFIMTANNLTCLQVEAVMASGGLNMLDKETLVRG